MVTLWRRPDKLSKTSVSEASEWNKVQLDELFVTVSAATQFALTEFTTVTWASTRLLAEHPADSVEGNLMPSASKNMHACAYTYFTTCRLKNLLGATSYA